MFSTTRENLMKFSGKMWLIIKSHKKLRLHSFSEKYIFWKVTWECGGGGEAGGGQIEGHIPLSS